MIEYKVRSVSLLNLINDIRNRRLIPDAYFQRNLVWRDVHKREFIETILKGYPFPQIFISKGKVDVEEMSTVSCIVDGQQRCNAIEAYISEQFEVGGRTFSNLTDEEKSAFLKYDVPVIELDLENDDPKVQEIFQRINRTSSSLTSIEKLASQYSTSEFMLVGKLLVDQVSLKASADEDFREDPNIPEDFYNWAAKQKVKSIQKLMSEKGVFSYQEIARKTNLMHILNVMATLLAGYSNRNEKANDLLDDYALSFGERDNVVRQIEAAAELILSLGFKGKSYWLNKANVFTLLIVIASIQVNGGKLDKERVAHALKEFEAELPADYKLSATEAVNGTKARQLRGEYISEVLLKTLS
ncbi:hypothetical protein C1929_07615 [Stenotrophomonas sp. ZAC14D1_NAIMI4_6]|uniref:DUF262 domain-containing protein n=1 Tax=unclassified Stenotrophomonas maltophilia group TaxID=2961925 RepID=UPI000D53FCC2|nr:MULTISPECIES: DUF262 domain-containing protein [unclassified Stenotrophomonas maltophilia group]AWH36627.1 hypothetical protein C1929_07615 [Stenotrophomonas sp. ZAC14D1_NAIMI4_6]AWH40817.1 hypothetical protein C1927_07940 [Stenotrophomonas sp. ZAC14D1_NAIMI4_1]